MPYPRHGRYARSDGCAAVTALSPAREYPMDGRGSRETLEVSLPPFAALKAVARAARVRQRDLLARARPVARTVADRYELPVSEEAVGVSDADVRALAVVKHPAVFGPLAAHQKLVLPSRHGPIVGRPCVPA